MGVHDDRPRPGLGRARLRRRGLEARRGRASARAGPRPSASARRWDADRIWLRTTVELPRLGPDDALTLRLFHDEDVEVFVNGKRLFREEGFTTAYGDRVLSEAQKALFHPGNNVVAVSCRQTRGGRGSTSA